MSAESPKKCFVIGPIGNSNSPERTHADWLLRLIVKPVFAQFFPDTIVERSDKISEPGMIDSQIINLLHECDLVIADLSTLNPNVFYEIGIRHVVRKPIIHMFLEGTNIPFDIKPYRSIPFKLAHPDDLDRAQEELKSAVDAVRAPKYEVWNPVTRARGQYELEKTATPPQQVLMQEMDELKNRVHQLERMRRLEAEAERDRIVAALTAPRVLQPPFGPTASTVPFGVTGFAPTGPTLPSGTTGPFGVGFTSTAPT